MKTSPIYESGLAEPSLPRDNGAPVFEAPWQGRAFALAVLTVERTGHRWDDFRALLISCIDDDPQRTYWESWVAALDRFLAECGLEPGTR